MKERRLFIGCAGWSIPASEKTSFPKHGSHLQRYATQFTAVEINSSFYRPHRGATYARWAETAGDDFRFSVKAPRTITHEAKLRPDPLDVERFVTEINHLGAKLGCMLVQFPPSLRWEPLAGREFFETLRKWIVAPIACEPRHKSWFTDEVEKVLTEFYISRVVADPCLVAGGEIPGGWTSFVYYRLHGSPRTYYSTYDTDYLASLTRTIQKHIKAKQTCWCIFDNTAAGAASRNALDLLAQITGVGVQ